MKTGKERRPTSRMSAFPWRPQVDLLREPLVPPARDKLHLASRGSNRLDANNLPHSATARLPILNKTESGSTGRVVDRAPSSRPHARSRFAEYRSPLVGPSSPSSTDRYPRSGCKVSD